MGALVRDSRLVQTAVIGNEHSDVPVVLPVAAIELDAFRRRHRGDSFWCGLLLGGCGARLADKLYVDRQCHFQHYPSGPDGGEAVCRRGGVGESSADHLYVKGALQTSLAKHGRAARFSYPEPIGSGLDVDLGDGRRFRVHLGGRASPVRDGSIPIVGADVPLEPGTLTRCRYVYRVRVQSEGPERRVWIGTESLARPTEWVPLADCGWTGDGLVTEAAQRILRERSAGPTPHAQTLPEAVTRLIRGLEAAQRSGTVEHVRRLYEGSEPLLETLEPHARTQAQQALAEARTWLDGHMGYQQSVFADLERAVDEKRAWDVREHYNRATTLTRRGASDAELRILQKARRYLQEKNHQPAPDTATRRRQALDRLAPAPQRAAAVPPTRPDSHHERARRQQQAAVLRVRRLVAEHQQTHMSPTRRAEKFRELHDAVTAADDALTRQLLRQIRALREKYAVDETAPPGYVPRPAAGLPDETLAAAAAKVRSALIRVARAQQTLTWAALKGQLGTALPDMTDQERQHLIALVDAASERDEPLLSSVLAAADPQLAEAYRLSANLLGGHLPPDDRELLRDVIDADAHQTHAYWRPR
ncbi:hypothetical protein PO587_38700 [Streptomyces gilvifuscus]|uniref:Uncharacterized protein n=1 Tax=Streptomyces gilvifuscus TaxID=1550617 RepID=A0ABT5G6Z7_9ACTN|nr:hypothetical protein [Streptomyces gilvifuscus]MDC2960372.1 hypothetical protein [Streptomyces gilvifuscus]